MINFGSSCGSSGVYRIENRKSSSSDDAADRQSLYRKHRDQSYRSSMRRVIVTGSVGTLQTLHPKSGTQRVHKDHTKRNSTEKSNWRLRHGGGQRGWQNYMGAHEKSHS